MTIDWCIDEAQADAAARFFVSHADASYISHSELQFGRATAPGLWSHDLHATVLGDAARAIAQASKAEAAGTHLALSTLDGDLAGMAFVTFVPAVRTPFAVLEDLIVAPARQGHGLGRAMLAWVAAECRTRGLRRLFLESGLDNHRAHHFFIAQGFAQTSIVMMRDL